MPSVSVGLSSQKHMPKVTNSSVSLPQQPVLMLWAKPMASDTVLEFNLSTAQAQAADIPRFTYLLPSTKGTGEQDSIDPNKDTKLMI